MRRRRALAEVESALERASGWEEWRAAAEEHDRLTGMEAWRADDESPCYDAGLLKRDLARLRTLREGGKAAALVEALTTSVYRHQSEVSAPELYRYALAGTKHLVSAWLEEAERSLRWLAANPVPGMTPAEKLARFEQAWAVFGRSALMLSGGATWGFHHLGVVKALFERGALPHILSGASTGAMVAAGVCTRDDAGLARLFADPSTLRLDGLLSVGARRALHEGAWLDPDRLHDVLRHNIGDLTFAEAFARSGRALVISVSPTRTHQKPRVLSHLTAPDVLVPSAVLASSALPGLFPPVQLQSRTQSGGVQPYVPTERWVDGSIAGDLPKLRLARLHNVNHFVVSQVNPHVLPFASLRRGRGVAPAVAGAATVTARTQGAWATDLLRRAVPAWTGPLRQVADQAYAVASQEYSGDIDIHPRFRLEMLGKIVSNPSTDDLRTFILEGERATWPRVPMILDQTRIGKVFRECVEALRAAG